MPNGNRDVYKIAILGDEGCGKTALLVRFLTGRYIVDYDPTIEDTYRKIFLINDEPESVDILDTTRLRNDSELRKEFLTHADGFIIVYAITDRHSFETVESYEREIREARGFETSTPYKVILVGNKSDMEKDRQVAKPEGQSIASKYGWGFCEASAAENTAISEVFFGLNEVHNNSLAEVLGSSSDSDCSCASETYSARKKTHKKSAHQRPTKFRNLNIFRRQFSPTP